MFSKISFSRSVFTKQFSVIDVLLKLKLKITVTSRLLVCVLAILNRFLLFLGR